jgi:hypothetical protein
LRIAVGTAAVGRVAVNATPATIPSGGSSTISASVFDVNGTALSGTAVSFSTDAGTLASNVVTTNTDGIATTSLTTSQTATITASVGATAPPAGGTGTTTPTGQSSGTAKVTVVPNTTVVITPPSTQPSAGLPATFTFVVTVPTGGNPVRELRVSWGDGSAQSLGAVSGSQAASHVYKEADSYLVTATVVDVAGISQTVSSTVTVIPVPRPTVLVTATPPTQVAQGTVNFAIQVTVPQGIGVVSRQAVGEADGVLPTALTVFADDVPAVANLDPELRQALRHAARDAGRSGIEIVINSGWRSPAYQQRLLRQAVAKYGSSQKAARWVVSADKSSHVSGDAVDLGPTRATVWLQKHGAAYGLCRIYRNEPWHFELRSGAINDGCPSTYADPARDPRMQR